VPTESFLARFAEKVQRTPDSTALSLRDRVVTYRQLSELAKVASDRLREYELSISDPLCVAGNKSPELLAMLLACFGAGRRVLLPPAGLGRTALLRLCERAGCRRLVTVTGGPSGRGTASLTPVGPATPGGRRTPLTPQDSGRPGLMLATSGSTGPPKIVPLDGPGVDRFIAWAAGQFGIGPGATVLSYAPLCFDLSLLDVWTSLASGAAVLVVAEDGATDGRRLLDLAATATVVQGVPMLFRLLADAAAAPGPHWSLPAVRHAVFTGDAMPSGLLGAVRRLMPRAELYNLYGCTETNDSFLHRIDGAAAELAGLDEPPPIGRPIPGVTAAVLGAGGTVLAGEATGELVVRTPFQSRGYLDPELDRGRFCPAPAGLPAGRYYRTGDVVHRDADGLVRLLGRADSQVKVRGVRVNTQEVEAVIVQHREVLEAAVVALPDELGGHRLHAAVRRRPGAALGGLQLRQHCAALLVRTAIPTSIELVEEPLPRTSTGKIDRNRIRLSWLKGKVPCPR